jgi:hypothetical protein
LVEKKTDVIVGYSVFGCYVIRQDFGFKIVGEMSFSLFFKETKQVLTFESQSVGTMWTVISSLTKACQFSPNAKLEHSWADFYVTSFNLTNDSTNKTIKKKSNEPNSNSKKVSVENSESSSDFNILKENFIKNKLKERESEFTEFKKLT